MPWTLNGAELANLSAGGATLSFRSQGVSELLIRKAGACDQAPIASGTWCELVDSIGRTVFQGEAVLVQGTATGSSEENVTRVVDPWNDLERLAWRDGINMRLTIDAATPLQDAVSTVLAGAITLGARFTIGTIDLPGNIPSVAFDNTTCAAILISLLRWSPGAVQFFNHNTSGLPTINIIAADKLATLSLPAEGCLGLKVTPRTDLRVAGVRLFFRKTIESTYGSAEGLLADSSGAPDEPGGLIMALDLSPARVQFALQSNRLKVEEIEITSGDWWRKYGCNSSGDPVSTGSSGDTSFNFFVTAGQLQNWMLNTINGEANGEEHGCTGPLAASPGTLPTGAQAFSTIPPDLHIPNSQSFILGRRKVAASFSDGRSYSLDLPVTNLSQSGTYYRETRTAWEPGDELPTGLAETLFAAASRLAYSGSLSVVQIECTPFVHGLGDAINILGTAWADIRAPLYSVTHDLGAGKTALEFGPSAYLGAADLLELKRAVKNRALPSRAAIPAPALPSPVKYGAVISSAAPPPNGPQKGTLTVSCTDEIGNPFSEGSFAVGGTRGRAGQTVELDPGEYIVIFLPAWGRKTPNSATVNVGPGDDETASGQYMIGDEAYLEQPSGPTRWMLFRAFEGGVLSLQSGGNSITLEPGVGIGITGADGRGAYLSTAGRMQLRGGESGEKQVWMDPADVPSDGTVVGFGGTNGFASWMETEDCGEGET